MWPECVCGSGEEEVVVSVPEEKAEAFDLGLLSGTL